MLKHIRNSDPQNLLFTAILLLSVVLHSLILSQLKWHISLPDKTETVFEVELLEPEKKVVPPRPVPVAVKPEPRDKKEDKPMLVERKTAPAPRAGEPEAAPQAAPVPARKPKPAKPVPKPMLNIMSDVGKSVDLKESDIPVGNRTPKTPRAAPVIPRVNTPQGVADEQQVIPESRKPAPKLTFDPDELKRASGRESLDTGQIAGPNSEGDIKTEISRKRDTVRYRVVKQGGKGTSQVRGSQDKGENLIEGELRRRKVIYKPKPPLLHLEKDVTITLKFTVLPNGEVDRIFPFRKAEPELEQLAMRLLRQYRFEPLFENDKIQQGIIHFTIYRNR